MISIEFTLQSKIIVFISMTVFLYCSCAAIDLPQTSAENSNENALLNSQQLPVTNQKIENAVNEKIKLPYQTRVRRKIINFPEDCHYLPNQSSKNWQLELACAESLDSVLPNLPDAGCQYESFQKAKGLFYSVVENSEILTYTVQETDIDDLENLATKLGTTRDNIVSNNKFNNSGKLSIGQELKYQKSHLEKSSSSWFDGYDIDFYSLLPNKYLVKVRCWVSTYNLSNVYLLYDESSIPAKAEVLDFPDLEFSFDKDDQESEHPISFKQVMVKSIPGRIFNSKTKELITLNKKTGIGYAGHYARYSFPNGKPKLEEYRAKFKEDGNGIGDNWLETVPKMWKRYDLK